MRSTRKPWNVGQDKLIDYSEIIQNHNLFLFKLKFISELE